MSGLTKAIAALPITGLLSCAAPAAQPLPEAKPGSAIQFVQHTMTDCLAAVGGQRSLCEGAGAENSIVEIATVDIDGDHDLDFVIRRLSALACGSHGCSTDIYLRRGSGLVIAEPRLVTAGPIMPCEAKGARGLRASTGANAPCFIFRPAIE